MTNSFYITTTLPYVNAEPHIGFALEILEADVIARYQRLLGNDVFFNTGVDEHGQKIYQQATKADLTPQEYCDQTVQQFQELAQILNLDYDKFIRTTDPAHQQAAQEFWKKALANGDIYQASYPVKYCVGCELEKTESELENDHCPLHPNQELEIRNELNYFFRFSKYQQSLLDLYDQHPEFVQPASKMNEVIAFVKSGLKDFSISRIKEKMPWGITVPDDPNQVMYVWFDALVNYISTLGWPSDRKTFDHYWPVIQVAGKDNLRQQAAMWQAMLMSVNLPPSKKILINGFIRINGQKMSKSLGNIISPQQMKDRYGSQATRYLLLSLGTFADDIDVNWQKFDEHYQADLANGIGNLCSRVAKMATGEELTYDLETDNSPTTFDPAFTQLMNQYQLSSALDWIWRQIKETDLLLSQQQPWQLEGQAKNQVLQEAVKRIRLIAKHLQPFMPETAITIQQHFSATVKQLAPLFPRL
jgi:methionyl-tRNA synthetase